MANGREEMAELVLGAGVKGLMDERGITAEALVDALREELRATERATVRIRGRGARVEPGAKVIGRSGEELVAEVERPAWAVRQRARMDAHTLRGDYPAARTESEMQITVVFADPWGRAEPEAIEVEARPLEPEAEAPGGEVEAGVSDRPALGPVAIEAEVETPRGSSRGGRGPERPPAPRRDSNPHLPPQAKLKTRKPSTKRIDP